MSNPKDEIKKLAGVDEGTELNGEIVVGDYDKDGKLIGWHKEEKKEGGKD